MIRAAQLRQDLCLQFTKKIRILLNPSIPVFGDLPPVAERRRRFLVVHANCSETRIAVAAPAYVELTLWESGHYRANILHDTCPSSAGPSLPLSVEFNSLRRLYDCAVAPLTGSTNMFIPPSWVYNRTGSIEGTHRNPVAREFSTYRRHRAFEPFRAIGSKGC